MAMCFCEEAYPLEPGQLGSSSSGITAGLCMAESSQAWGPDSGQTHSMPCPTCVGNALALAPLLLQAGSLPD